MYSSSVGMTITVTEEPAALMTCGPLPTASRFLLLSMRTPSHSKQSQKALRIDQSFSPMPAVKVMVSTPAMEAIMEPACCMAL